MNNEYYYLISDMDIITSPQVLPNYNRYIIYIWNIYEKFKFLVSIYYYKMWLFIIQIDLVQYNYYKLKVNAN